MRGSKKGNLIFSVLLVAYGLYAALFIYNSSFVVGGERYFVLFDDAMISMRYARNLAEGSGLVWNAGETPVEGYTNPLWTVGMAALHLLPVEASKVSVLVQISGAVFILASLVFVRKLALELSKSELVSLLAVLVTAFYMPLNNWALLGMEVSLLVLLICASTYLFLHNLRESRFSIWPYLLLGIGTLVRFDMAVPYLVSLVFLTVVDARHRKAHLLWGLGFLVIALGSQTLFRWTYYQDLLPNTYYLKVTGYPIVQRIARGLYALFTFVWGSNWVLMLLPLTLLIFRRDREILLVFALIAGQAVYSAYVGGDAWEHRGGSNRYLALIMPLFFILFTYSLSQLTNSLAAKVKGDPKRIAWWSNLIVVGLVIIGMLNFNYLLGKNLSLARWLLLRPPMFSIGNSDYVRIARDIEQITTPEARIAVVAAGTTPYFSNRPAIDLLGKSDRRIAHQPVRNSANWYYLESFRPGHMKWDYDYTIGELKPDLIVQLWGDTQTAQKYIDRDYVAGGAGNGFFYALRKGSPEIRWDQVSLCTGDCLTQTLGSDE